MSYRYIIATRSHIAPMAMVFLSRISEIETKNELLEAAFCGPPNQYTDHKD